MWSALHGSSYTVAICTVKIIILTSGLLFEFQHIIDKCMVTDLVKNEKALITNAFAFLVAKSVHCKNGKVHLG